MIRNDDGGAASADGTLSAFWVHDPFNNDGKPRRCTHPLNCFPRETPHGSHDRQHRAGWEIGLQIIGRLDVRWNLIGNSLDAVARSVDGRIHSNDESPAASLLRLFDNIMDEVSTVLAQIVKLKPERSVRYRGNIRQSPVG